MDARDVAIAAGGSKIGWHAVRRAISGLRGRLLLLVLLATIPAAQELIYHTIVQRHHLLDSARNEAASILEGIVNSTQLLIRGTEQVLATLAAVPEVAGGDPGPCSRFLAKLQQQHRAYENLGTIELNGDIACSALPLSAPINLAGSEYFQRALATRAFVVGGFQAGAISREAVLAFGYPVLDDAGSVRKVIFASLPFTWVHQEFGRAKLPVGSVIYVTDASDRVLARLAHDKDWSGKAVHEASLADAIRKSAGRGSAEVDGLDGVHRLFAFAPLPGIPGEKQIVVSAGLPTDTAYAAVRESLIQHLVLLAFMAGLVLAVVWWGGNVFVLRQVRALQHASRRLAQGDLGARAQLAGQQGELADLARAFNDMAGEIEKRANEAAEYSERTRRLNRIYNVLSSINTTILRVQDRNHLFNEACQIAVEHGGFGMAWISELDPVTLDVTPVAWAGIGATEHATSKSTARSDVPLGHGVVGRCIREKKIVACNDIAAEPDVGSAKRRAALRLGYRSLAGLPLLVEGNVVGTMTLYAREPNFFTADEFKLLSELAGDISFALEHIEKRERVEHLANYDALTGVANRNLLNDRLAQALARAHRSNYMVAVAVLDLDNFKLINDSLGHRTGDDLLKIVASRLKACIRESDTLARLGGDEFVLILPGQTGVPAAFRAVERITERVSTDSRVFEILKRILDALSEPMLAGGRELRLTCSIGVSLYPQDGEDPEDLLRNAAAALSRAKQLGRNNFQFYTAELNAQIAERLSLHSSLRRALERDEFTVFYQPKISLQTGEMSGVEALLRWQTADSGVVAPAKFISILEETGLIVDVGRRVMERAVVEYALWRANSVRPPRIAVNVSQLQLAQKDFPAVVRDCLKKDPSGAVGLDIEITESLIMQDIEGNISKLKALREMGVNIAIDDFGTGYSSLSYLAKLPVNAVKIDRAFIRDMQASPDGLTIVTTIISLAHSLGLKVVAEGVETEAQGKMLQLLKCDEMQGYWVTPPLSAEQFKRWWEHFSPQPTVPGV